VSATATSKSREQRRAYMASELVRDIASGSSKRRVDGKKFASLVYGLPVMVLSNGLLQTVAFLGAKAGPRGADGESAQHRVLLDAIADDLRSFGLLGQQVELVDAAAQAPPGALPGVPPDAGGGHLLRTLGEAVRHGPVGQTGGERVSGPFARDAVKGLASKVSNPGLRWSRFYPVGKVTGSDSTRVDFLETFERKLTGDAVSAYSRALARWKTTLEGRAAPDRGHAVDVWTWATRSRLAFGLGDEHGGEVGLRLQRTYGLPLVSGAALKGVARAFARAHVPAFSSGGAGADGVSELERLLFGNQGVDPKRPSESIAESGVVTFHDALWDPAGDGPFLVDTVTVHHPGYYQGSAFPSDGDSPTPIPYLTVVGRFLFALEGPAEAVAFCRRLLASALDVSGVGGRTKKGYGRFRTATSSDGLELVAGGGAGAQRSPTPASGPKTEETRITYRPNTGTFHLRVGDAAAQVSKGEVAVFGSVEAVAELEKVCRRKGSVAVTARFLADGSARTILSIERK
jgi:CRISPR type III-B/RAMP module RAMP protein Cmr6